MSQTPTGQHGDSLLTLREAADRLGMSVAGIRRWIARGLLPRVRLGRAVRLRRSDIDRVIAEGLPPRRAGR